MDNNKLAELAKQKLSTPEGKEVDVVFSASDGEMFFGVDEAEQHASKLADKTIKPFYRDEQVRRIAEFNEVLNMMVVATDYIKLHKLYKKIPVYDEFVKASKELNNTPIEEKTFNFIMSKVFRSNKPVHPGQTDEIYMYKLGIVKAVFLRRYTIGQVWQVGDNLVFTCPTNTELMSGTYQEIFAPMFEFAQSNTAPAKSA